MRKALIVLTALLTLTTLSFAESNSETQELITNSQTQSSALQTAIAGIDKEALAKSFIAGIKGEGWNFKEIAASLFGAVMLLGCGWLRERLKSKKSKLVMATLLEGSQATEATLRYMATGKPEDGEEAIKECRQVIAVPKALWEEIRLERPGIDNISVKE